MFVTERLVLRPALLTDLEALHEILADPEQMRFWSTPPHSDLQRTRAWLESMIAARAEGRSVDDCIVEFEGRVVGKAGFWRAPELGFIFPRRVQGLGIAAEALEALLARAFELRGLARVTADVDPRNERCLRLLARLGLRETGRRARTFCIAGVWSDSVDLELTAQAWRATR